jgi:hypothetical protein
MIGSRQLKCRFRKLGGHHGSRSQFTSLEPYERL